MLYIAQDTVPWDNVRIPSNKSMGINSGITKASNYHIPIIDFFSSLRVLWINFINCGFIAIYFCEKMQVIKHLGLLFLQ
jgi:hypothetical protein